MSKFDIYEQMFSELTTGVRCAATIPYEYTIAEGTLPDHLGISKFGHNPDVGAVLEEVWDGTNPYAGYLTTASVLEIASADIDDQGLLITTGTNTGGSKTVLIDTEATFETDSVAIGDAVLDDTNNEYGIVTSIDSETQITMFAAVIRTGIDGGLDFTTPGSTYRIVNANDTGAAVVEIQGLDANWAFQKDFIILNGQTDVLTTNTYLRVFRAKVILAGSSGWNEGTIDVDDAGNTNLIGRITAKYNQTLMAMWTVPASKMAYVTRVYATTAIVNKPTTIHIYVRWFGSVFQLKKSLTLTANNMILDWSVPMAVPEKSDIKIMALAEGGGGAVSAGFDLWYEPKSN